MKFYLPRKSNTFNEFETHWSMTSEIFGTSNNILQEINVASGFGKNTITTRANKPTTKNANMASYSTISNPRNRRGARPRLFEKNACQADGCKADLSRMPWYNRRNHICQEHVIAETMTVLGQPSRFCQRCGHSQPLSDFEGLKRSCQASLEKYNAARRERGRRRRRGHKGAAQSVSSTPELKYEEEDEEVEQESSNFQVSPTPSIPEEQEVKESAEELMKLEEVDFSFLDHMDLDLMGDHRNAITEFASVDDVHREPSFLKSCEDEDPLIWVQPLEPLAPQEDPALQCMPLRQTSLDADHFIASLLVDADDAPLPRVAEKPPQSTAAPMTVPSPEELAAAAFAITLTSQCQTMTMALASLAPLALRKFAGSNSTAPDEQHACSKAATIASELAVGTCTICPCGMVVCNP